MAHAPLLELKDIGKTFRSGDETLAVLRNVSLAVSPSETMAITGSSGSGKSTLLGIMAGLERPSSGDVLYQGESLRQWDEDRLAQWRRSQVGFVFQNFRLVKTLTALENVALPLEILGASRAEAQARAISLLNELGLAQRCDHYPSQLSGGEQQRIAIARAYAHKPQLIFADEPTGSLDNQTAEKILDLLLSVNKAAGTALIMVTHNSAAAAKMGYRVALANGGIAP